MEPTQQDTFAARCVIYSILLGALLVELAILTQQI